MTNLCFPSYVFDRYTFALLFHTPKFPPLPSNEFTLAFRFPFPRWFTYGSSLEVIQNECKKPTEQVVVTKHDIYSYSGHFHVYIENVEIISIVHAGDTSKEI